MVGDYPPMLSKTAHRARAAAMIGTSTTLPALTAATVADTLDAVAGAVLRTAGVPDDAARSILAALWGDR